MSVQLQVRRDTAANWTSANPTLAAGEFGWEKDTKKIKVGDGATAWNSLAYSFTGLSDGDKGDITVSGSGATFTIDNDVVTYAKMQNASATARILARITAGSGDYEEATIQQVLGLLVTTRGDLVTRDGSTVIRKAVGAANQFLGTDGTDILWKSVSGCEVSRASQTIASSGLVTLISFTDADTTDTDNYHDPSSNPGRIVAPFTGWYDFVTGVDHQADSSTAGLRRIIICKNQAGAGGDANALIGTTIQAGASMGSAFGVVPWRGKLTAGDYLEVYYSQTSGGNRNCHATATMIFRGA